MRLVTFIGVGRDPHTFGLIADLGRQSFQCAAFWCQPHAGGLSEAVQAACMVSYGWEWVGGVALQLLCAGDWGSGSALSRNPQPVMPGLTIVNYSFVWPSCCF